MVVMEWPSRANHQVAQQTDAQKGPGEGCVKDLWSLAWATDACMYCSLQFGAGWLRIGHTLGNSFSVNLFDSVLHSHHIAAR